LFPTHLSIPFLSQGQGNATLFAGTTALGETLPHTLIFTTGAENPDNNSENILDYLPKVKGKFGLGEVKEHNCRVASSPKGGTNYLMFNSFPDVLIELYPDRLAAKPVLVKTDGGPGRTNTENLAKARENHIILFTGFPNRSGFNQEQVGVALCVHCAHVAPRLTWDPKPYIVPCSDGICLLSPALGRQDALYAEFKRLLTLAFEELKAARCQEGKVSDQGYTRSVAFRNEGSFVSYAHLSGDSPLRHYSDRGLS